MKIRSLSSIVPDVTRGSEGWSLHLPNIDVFRPGGHVWTVLRPRSLMGGLTMHLIYKVIVQILGVRFRVPFNETNGTLIFGLVFGTPRRNSLH